MKSLFSIYYLTSIARKYCIKYNVPINIDFILSMKATNKYLSPSKTNKYYPIILKNKYYFPVNKMIRKTNLVPGAFFHYTREAKNRTRFLKLWSEQGYS